MDPSAVIALDPARNPRASIYDVILRSDLFRTSLVDPPHNIDITGGQWGAIFGDGNSAVMEAAAREHFIHQYDIAAARIPASTSRRGDVRPNPIDVAKNAVALFNQILTNVLPPMAIKISKSLDGDDDEEVEPAWGPTSFLRFLTGDGRKARDNLQRITGSNSNATVQCDAVIPRPVAGERCYLCGFEMLSGEPLECEHRLPVFSAIFLAALAKTNPPPPGHPLRASYEALMQLEYKWSHACCNKVKNNYEFIRPSMAGNPAVHYEIVPHTEVDSSTYYIKQRFAREECPRGTGAEGRSSTLHGDGRTFTEAIWNNVSADPWAQIVTDFGQMCDNINTEINNVFGGYFNSHKRFLLLMIVSYFDSDTIFGMIQTGLVSNPLREGGYLPPVDYNIPSVTKAIGFLYTRTDDGLQHGLPNELTVGNVEYTHLHAWTYLKHHRQNDSEYTICLICMAILDNLIKVTDIKATGISNAEQLFSISKSKDSLGWAVQKIREGIDNKPNTLGKCIYIMLLSPLIGEQEQPAEIVSESGINNIIFQRMIGGHYNPQYIQRVCSFVDISMFPNTAAAAAAAREAAAREAAARESAAREAALKFTYTPPLGGPYRRTKINVNSIPSVKRPMGGPEKKITYVDSRASSIPYSLQGGSRRKKLKRSSHLKRTHKKRTKKFKRK
jgi:hypothetical protein